jgi:hypothetical protein
MTAAYRTATYIAFYANGKTEPKASYSKYYDLLTAWNVREDNDFCFTDSHEKAGAIQNSSQRETVTRLVKQRLLRSRNMLLIIGQTTKEDTDWVPLEIRYAVDECRIPVIAAYPGYTYIMAPRELWPLWPEALAVRIRDARAHVIHTPFRKEALTYSVRQFDHYNFPPRGGLGYYNEAANRRWGYL